MNDSLRDASERVSVKSVLFYMRNVRTRMPFKYGVATLTSVPILHAEMTIESADGTVGVGVSADILPPKWFDKDPSKDYRHNVHDLLFVARSAADAFLESSRSPRTMFEIWRDGYAATLAAGDSRELNHLTSSHGSTLMERALIDAIGRLKGLSYHEMLQENTLGIRFESLHSQLQGVTPGDVIASPPLAGMYVRHTVGLADPIMTADIPSEDRLDDGLPQSLEEYVDEQGISYLKIKVNGDLEADLERIRQIASLMDRSEKPYHLTLDGNEQYRSMDIFRELLVRIEEDNNLNRFYDSILFIEQPLERSTALNPDLADGIRSISARKPMLVDESDGDIDTFKEAVRLGYKGVSSKNCKGLIKALANLGLVRYLGQGYFLSGEDLMNLPVVPVHQDLTHVACLGVNHVERNGHHYVHGLNHLSEQERETCRKNHGTLYRELGDSLVLDIQDGKIDISSLQIPGLGSGDATATEHMIPLDDWEFESLA